MSDLYDSLLSSLNGCTNTATLFRLATSDQFRDSAKTLGVDELEALRSHFQILQKDLDGKVKLEQFNGQILVLNDVQYWHSSQYNNDGVTLKYRPEIEPDHEYKSLTSSAAVVRFCNSLDPQPTGDNPVRIMIHLEPVSDDTRARAGQKQWRIKRMPNPGDAQFSPF